MFGCYRENGNKELPVHHRGWLGGTHIKRCEVQANRIIWMWSLVCPDSPPESSWSELSALKVSVEPGWPARPGWRVGTGRCEEGRQDAGGSRHAHRDSPDTCEILAWVPLISEMLHCHSAPSPFLSLGLGFSTSQSRVTLLCLRAFRPPDGTDGLRALG